MPDEELSPNMEALAEADRQLSIMKKLVSVFETGIITDIKGLELDLSEEQVATLVSNFVTARTACIAELNKVSG